MDSYERWALRVAERRADELSAELWARGTLGIEILEEAGPTQRWVVYFSTTTSDERAEAVDRLEDRGAVVESIETMAGEDWMARYREASRPFAVGAGLWVDPGDPARPAEEGPAHRVGLRLPARSAFGIGSHESTRLAVELLEAEEVAGWRCLDLGTGSGILSFLLLLRGAASVVAIDIDPIAALQAGQNARWNGLTPSLVGGGTDSISRRTRFDLCVANMLPVHLQGELSTIAELVPTGPVVFAGALESEDRDHSERLRTAGFEIVERRCLGEWIGYRTLRGRS